MSSNINKFIKIIIWITISAFIIRLLISWQDISSFISDKKISELLYSLWGFAGEAIVIGSIFIVAFEKWLWRVEFIQKLHGTPVLSKKYNGSIHPNFDNIERPITLYITQTFLKIKVSFETEESNGGSLNADIQEINGQIQLVYDYSNDPQADVRDRSPRHYGTAILRLKNDSTISGNYYTDRKTTGTMILEPSKNID